MNFLIHKVAHTYHLEIREPIPQTNFAPQYTENTHRCQQFSLHQLYMTGSSTLEFKSNSLYNVQPTSHTTKPRTFPSVPDTKENVEIMNKLNFQVSDLTDTEYVTICNLLIKHKICYTTHEDDVGKISTPFCIRLEPNAGLMTQRPSKVPIH